jgi:hypothetical protein
MDDGSILIAVDLDKQKQFTVEGRTITSVSHGVRPGVPQPAKRQRLAD